MGQKSLFFAGSPSTTDERPGNVFIAKLQLPGTKIRKQIQKTTLSDDQGNK